MLPLLPCQRLPEVFTRPLLLSLSSPPIGYQRLPTVLTISASKYNAAWSCVSIIVRGYFLTLTWYPHMFRNVKDLQKSKSSNTDIVHRVEVSVLADWCTAADSL